MTHNGWTNHETWLMSLYLTGNYGYIAAPAREERIASAAALGWARLKVLVTNEVTIDNRHDFGDARYAVVNFQNECIGSLLNAADWKQLADHFAPKRARVVVTLDADR